MVDRNYAQKDLFIVPVKTLRVGDTVRDFHSADPTFGLVHWVDNNQVMVKWDDGSGLQPLSFKDKGGHRCDIIRLRRRHEVVGIPGSLPPAVEKRLLDGPDPDKTVSLTNEAFAYVRNCIDIDAGENAPTTEVHTEVLTAFNIDF